MENKTHRHKNIAMSGEDQKYKRYMRQINLLGKFHDKLLKSKVLVLGLGGLGSLVAYYLAAAGINLGLLDKDKVEWENLNRQILFTEKDIGKYKTRVAKRNLKKLNSTIKLWTHTLDILNISERRLKNIISKYDVVVDCLDNLDARFKAYAITMSLKKPFVFGAVERFSGFQSTMLPNSKNTLYKLYENKLPSRCTNIIGPTAGIMASIQALEIIKLITGIGEVNTKLLVFNGIKNEFSFYDF